MSGTMLAVIQPSAAPGAEIRQVPIPQFGPRDVLVKVKVASICGTDLHIYNWDRWAQGRIHPPLIPGHEFCGEVAAFGNEVTSVKEGDFVSAEMHVACGKCLQCRTGEAHICQNVKIIASMPTGRLPSMWSFRKAISGSSIPPYRRSTLPFSILWGMPYTQFLQERSRAKP
jgi:threonine dehydrogenase-like Zn-dependent dehydrogenase